MGTKATKSERKVVSREVWIAARKKLLEAEKELTRRSDEVNDHFGFAEKSAVRYMTLNSDPPQSD